MSGVISTRTSREERAQLRRQAQEMFGDEGTISDLIRVRCGLPRGLGLTAPLPEIDSVDDLTGLMKQLVVWIDRQDTMNQMIIRIAKHLNVPLLEDRGRGRRTEYVPEPVPTGFAR